MRLDDFPRALNRLTSPLPDLGAVMIARRVAPLMQSLRRAVSSDGVASKTSLTSHGWRTVRERKVRCAFRQDVAGLAS
jgi:hypothetical protein